MKAPKVVSEKQWLAARQKLLAKEKEFTRARDRLAAAQRTLPWTKVEKPYVFESARGPVSLADLFGGHSQLVVQHFMLGPGWEEGCKSCSFMMDHFAATVPHLAARDVAFAAISRAPLAEIRRFQKRMGWAVNWVSSHGTDFNYDYHVSFTPEEIERGRGYYNFAERELPVEELPGVSVFAKDKSGTVYHTYSTYGRGVEFIMATYQILDLVPKGRDENPDWPQDWVRHHDRYGRQRAAS
ncbi:MAG TPA: thioredoxin family protein [Lacunisphaera sp.]|nr:thioredoxin family protein [Lacunisphaera sp.]